MAKAKEGDFEKYLESLEGIVKELESGELSLEKSIDSFEKGVELYKNCKKNTCTAMGCRTGIFGKSFPGNDNDVIEG